MIEVISEFLNQVFQNVLLAFLIYLLILYLGGNRIPSKYKKSVYMTILIVLLMSMVNPCLAEIVSKIILMIYGGIVILKLICK